ncbi:MAG: MFS transporter [Desulfovibrionaceae bacterium]|nr:MAG: MFS transporter [Desulfovibrionaceae bacterium]
MHVPGFPSLSLMHKGYPMVPPYPQNRHAVLTAGALLSMVNGILYSWSAFILPIEQEAGWPRSYSSLVFTFILVFFGLGMMSGGHLMRRFGPRLTAAGGSALLASGLITSSLVAAPWQMILTYGVIAGYGIGVANVIPSATALCWYPKKQGLACGIMAFSLAAGTLIFGAGLAGTLIAMTGYVSTLRILALLALLVAFPASLFLRYPPGYDRAPPHDKTADSGLDTRQMLKTPLFHRAWLWTCAVQTGGLMIIGHVTPYALEQGATPLQAGAAMGIYAAANGAGRLVFGMLFDARGPRIAMLADAACMTCSLLLLAALPPILGYAGLLTAMVGIALAFGGSIPLFSAFIARNFGPAHLESNIGMTATVFIFAGFAGPYAGGCLHDAIGSYTPAILMAGAIGISGILAAMHLPDRH